jgi:3-methyladenine DNA glycosylase AlkD
MARVRTPSVTSILARLKRRGSKVNRDGMARYGLVSKNVFGVSLGTLRTIAREVGPSHSLALALWRTGWHEARMLAVLVDEPAKVTPAQMDRWCRDFDNWGICDTRFALFDRTPLRSTKSPNGHRGRRSSSGEAFALLASLALRQGRPDRGSCGAAARRAGGDGQALRRRA